MARTITPIPPDVEQDLLATEARFQQARADLAAAADARAAAVKRAVNAGASRRAIAKAIGLTYGRVEQILKGT